MNIHTNIKEIIKKYGRGIINLIIAVGVSFILSARSLYFSTGQFGIEMFKSYFVNNPVSVSLLSGDRKPQIRF